LAVDGSQANKFPWWMYPFLGALKVLSASYLPWQPNSQGNNYWQSAAKDIIFPWLSRLGGRPPRTITLAVNLYSLAVLGRQGNS